MLPNALNHTSDHAHMFPEELCVRIDTHVRRKIIHPKMSRAHTFRYACALPKHRACGRHMRLAGATFMPRAHAGARAPAHLDGKTQISEIGVHVITVRICASYVRSVASFPPRQRKRSHTSHAHFAPFDGNFCTAHQSYICCGAFSATRRAHSQLPGAKRSHRYAVYAPYVRVCDCVCVSTTRFAERNIAYNL